MQVTDDVFQLIHSMSLSEKGYFKKFASLHVIGDKNNYVRLFEAIAEQKEYDEELLKKKFAGEAFITRISSEKVYLRNLILKSLRNYYAGSSSTFELRVLMDDAEILYNKALYKQLSKVLVKAKKIAEEYDQHTYLLQILHWEIELAGKVSLKKEHDADTIYKELFSTINKHKNISEYSLLSAQLQDPRAHAFIRNPYELVRYKNILDHPLFRSADEALSTKAMYLYYFCRGGYCFLKSDFKNAHVYTQKLSQLMEAHPHHIAESPLRYVFLLRNLILCEMQLSKHKEISLNIKKMKGVTVKSERIKNEIFYLRNDLELFIYLEYGRFGEGLKLAKKLQDELEKLGDNTIQHRFGVSLLVNISHIYFTTGNYPAANIYLNKILNYSGVDLRGDLFCFAKIMTMIIHFELKNYDLLPYLARSAYRALHKKGKLYKFESFILDFIRKRLPQTISKKELTREFENLKIQIEKIAEDPYERNALRYFDFISWLESKIENRSFLKIMKEKSLKVY